MGEELKKFLSESGGQIDEAMRKVLREKRENIQKWSVDLKISDLYSFIFDSLEKYLAGGKKVRGSLVMLGYEIGGGQKMDVLRAGCAIELMHGFLLIQDDIMDRDVMRRGVDTLHEGVRKWANDKLTTDSSHYGISIAMSVSDLLQFWASELFLGMDLDKKIIYEAWSNWVKVLETTAWGQMQDVSYESLEVGEEQILAMHEWKTGMYTISGPLSIGYLLSGKNEKIDSLVNYGLGVGIAYQLADDILGVFGESGKTGKGNVGDVMSNKRTLLRLKLLEMVSEEERRGLEAIFGNKSANESDLEYVKELMIRTGAKDYVENKSREYVNKSRVQVEMITENNDLRVILGQLADYVISRDR